MGDSKKLELTIWHVVSAYVRMAGIFYQPQDWSGNTAGGAEAQVAQVTLTTMTIDDPIKQI